MKRKFWLLGTALFAVNPCAHAENSEMLVKPFLNPIIGLTVLVACIFSSFLRLVQGSGASIPLTPVAFCGALSLSRFYLSE